MGVEDGHAYFKTELKELRYAETLQNTVAEKGHPPPPTATMKRARMFC